MDVVPNEYVNDWLKSVGSGNRFSRFDKDYSNLTYEKLADLHFEVKTKYREWVRAQYKLN